MILSSYPPKLIIPAQHWYLWGGWNSTHERREGKSLPQFPYESDVHKVILFVLWYPKGGATNQPCTKSMTWHICVSKPGKVLSRISTTISISRKMFSNLTIVSLQWPACSCLLRIIFPFHSYPKLHTFNAEHLTPPTPTIPNFPKTKHYKTFVHSKKQRVVRM